MQNCPPRSLPQALGGGPAGGARLRVSDVSEKLVLSGDVCSFYRSRTCIAWSMFRVSSATSDPTRRVSAP